MDLLNKMVESLTKEELRYFKIFAKRMDDSDNRKDFALLDYVRKSGNKYDDDWISTRLYGKTDKASFYRLKNRLLDYLGDYLTFHHGRKNDMTELNRLLSLYHIFLQKNQFRIALFYLKKAEQRADAIEHLEMLDVIYGNFVKLSNDLLEINPADYINKRRENAQKLNKLREADQILAAISYRLKVTQNFATEKNDVVALLNSTISEFSSNESFEKSKSFQTRVYRAVSQILLQQHNYVELEKFLKDTYKRFNSQHWFSRDNHDIKLQMLTYIVNSLFRNMKYAESLEYAAILGTEIKAFNAVLYDKYLFFYYNSMVINYSALDKAKALTILQEFEVVIKNKTNSYYDQFLYFNKAMLLHQLGKPEQGIRNIVKLYVNDNYQKADDAFKLKIAVSELIMHFDAGEPNSYILRSDSIKKQFKKLLTKGDFGREKEFIAILDKMAVTPGFKRENQLKKTIGSLPEVQSAGWQK